MQEDDLGNWKRRLTVTLETLQYARRPGGERSERVNVWLGSSVYLFLSFCGTSLQADEHLEEYDANQKRSLRLAVINRTLNPEKKNIVNTLCEFQISFLFLFRLKNIFFLLHLQLSQQ